MWISAGVMIRFIFFVIYLSGYSVFHILLYWCLGLFHVCFFIITISLYKRIDCKKKVIFNVWSDTVTHCSDLSTRSEVMPGQEILLNFTYCSCHTTLPIIKQ